MGSGAGGATAARELAAHGFEVLVLEAGTFFRPFTRSLWWASPLRRLGLLGGEQMISRFFPHMRILRSSKDLILVRGVTTGGSTTISCGNVVRAEQGLREIGLDLTPEFEELERLLKPSPFPRERWRPLTQRMFDATEEMGLKPCPTPKAVNQGLCISCGLCELGCAAGAKWDARRFLGDVEEKGGKIETRCPVRRLIIDGDRVEGVEAMVNGEPERIEADVVVLAAGGIGTAQILSASGIQPKKSLWVDVVLTLGGVMKGSQQLKEPPMAWYAKREHYILSPYIDILSHWFHGPWRSVPEDSRVGVMVKLADMPDGSVENDGSVRKGLTEIDRDRLNEGIELAKNIMEAAGVSGPFVKGLANGGHLGGTVPLSKEDVAETRPSWLPEGLWVADLSLLPRSQGLPTILTTAALALRVARSIVKAEE